MRRLASLALLLAAAAGLAGGPVAAVPAPPAPAPETIEIPQDSGTLKALLFKPDGAGPFPAVVGLHSCVGLYDRGGAIASRYRDWAQHLVKAGFAVLYPDSFGSRGLGSQCAVRHGPVSASRERVADANAARRWLQIQPFVQPGRVTLLGWSTGAVAVLWAVRRAGPSTKGEDKADFRSAVAFYPACGRLDNVAWSARIPTLILIGAADDWASANTCQQMVAGARGRSAGTSIIVYPGTYHDFDHPNRPLQLRNGYASVADHSGKFHTGTNPSARADALRRVPQWLAR